MVCTICIICNTVCVYVLVTPESLLMSSCLPPTSPPFLPFLPLLSSFHSSFFLFQVVTDLIHGDAVTMRDDGHGQVVLSGATEEPVKDAADLQGQLERAYVVLNE